MIKFEKNAELDRAMKNLILSMVDMDNYLTEILAYNERVLTSKMEEEVLNILDKYKIPHNGLKYDIKILTENPYYRDIKLNNVDTSTVCYENAIIKKRTLMNMEFHRPAGKYLFHYHPVGYFDRDIHLPVLKEEGRVWMSPAVSEIESMREGIEKGHGKCMTMGLGIGLIQYMWLLKEDVESVTVVEFNKDVIDLFDRYIRPQFKTDKKLEIIHGNALDYYNKDFLTQFDYGYIDFWESTEDGLEMYMKLMEKRLFLPHVDFWIEDSILNDVKYIVSSYLYDLYEGKGVANFIFSMVGESKVVAKKANRYFKTRNDIIKSEEELLNIIHDKSVLRELLSH